MTTRMGTTLLAFACVVAGEIPLRAVEYHGRQFIGYHRFEGFSQTNEPAGGAKVLLSPVISAAVDWDELVVSWNVRQAATASLTVEARPIVPHQTTKFYVLGVWSGDRARNPRQSLKDQRDDVGDVLTDTLSLKHPAREVQLRLTFTGSDEAPLQALKFLGLSFLDTKSAAAPVAPNRAAWGHSLPVPEQSQMDFPGGAVWCSPTSTTMILRHWSSVLQQPALSNNVPAVAAEVYDPNWPGTGNWPFNTAFAGGFDGMRAYVTRLGDVAELEDWIEAGVPVALSVSYNILKGKPRGKNDGHFVVCVGFTADGDVVVNDPGTKTGVRRVFPRGAVVEAWANSHNTVYLIYPDTIHRPPNRFGHWEEPP